VTVAHPGDVDEREISRMAVSKEPFLDAGQYRRWLVDATTGTVDEHGSGVRYEIRGVGRT